MKTNQKTKILSTSLSSKQRRESCRGYSSKDSGLRAGMTGRMGAPTRCPIGSGMTEGEKVLARSSIRSRMRGTSTQSGMTFPVGDVESGRSMVEMLGVLAIIGVLTIGGLAGYNYGMTRYRTNEVLDGANKRAYTVATQKTLGIDPINLSEFSDYDVTAGGTFQSSIKDWTGEFGIQVNNVRQEVCENLIKMVGDNTPLRAIAKISDEKDMASGECDAGESNNLYLVYNLDMMASIGGSSERSGSVAVPGGYCEAHPGECTETCGVNNVQCKKGSDYVTYADAVQACGGTEDNPNFFTPAELGCTALRQPCENAPTSGNYWLAGNSFGGTTLPPGFRFQVANGSLVSGARIYPALCK